MYHHQRRPESSFAARAPRATESKIVDIMTLQVLAEGHDTRGAVEVLCGVRSIVDVYVDFWVATPGRWRLLTIDEQRLLWSYRDREPVKAATDAPLMESASA